MLSDLLSLSSLPSVKHIALALASLLLYRLLVWGVWRPLSSPLRALQVAPGGKGFAGHQEVFMSYGTGSLWYKWRQQMGLTFAIKGYFWVHRRVYTVDPRAISYILSKPNIYGKTETGRAMIKRFMREGLIHAEGDRHRLQRRTAAKLFNRLGLKEAEAEIQEAMELLQDQLREVCANPDFHPSYLRDDLTKSTKIHQLPPSSHIVDVYDIATRLAWDTVGQSMIGRSFHSLSDPEGEGGRMLQTFQHFQSTASFGNMYAFHLFLIFPWLSRFFTSQHVTLAKDALDKLDAYSSQAIRERTAIIKEGKIDKLEGKDLVTIMLEHNMDPATKPEDRLTTAEISGQLATAAFGGTDTTSTLVAWTMRRLAAVPDVQERLRAECLEYGENLPFDQVDNLPFLDAVVRESLRLEPSVPVTLREAYQDDIIPLSRPIKDIYGREIHEIKIRKGQTIFFHISHINTAPEFWGPDADRLNPNRFLNVEKAGGMPDRAPDGPGVWPNIMTFGDGPRRCVGYKLAIMEMKMLLFTLVRGYTWELVPDLKIYKTYLFSTRPQLDNEEDRYSLPLMMRPYKGE